MHPSLARQGSFRWSILSPAVVHLLANDVTVATVTQSIKYDVNILGCEKFSSHESMDKAMFAVENLFQLTDCATFESWVTVKRLSSTTRKD